MCSQDVLSIGRTAKLSKRIMFPGRALIWQPTDHRPLVVGTKVPDSTAQRKTESPETFMIFVKGGVGRKEAAEAAKHVAAQPLLVGMKAILKLYGT